MKSRPELERIASYLTDFVSGLPASTRGAVVSDIQHCLQKVTAELEQQYVKQPPEPETEVEPAVKDGPRKKKV